MQGPAAPSKKAALGQLAVEVFGSDGVKLPFKWTLEEDLTFHVVPGQPNPNTLSVSFHRSYMPVVATGSSTALPMIDPAKHYFVSVLPTVPGYSLSGAPIQPGQTSVKITVNKGPLPTAQITVFVFHDNSPINNAPDLPGEVGLAGFHVFLEDAGGRYGQSGGQQMMDGFGNPLGTTYVPGGTTVDVMGEGYLLTDASGRVTIKNLAPGKYGVKVIPPAKSQGWVQTSTIEGTKVVDAWVKANEPAYFQEFGPPGYHAFFGFVKAMKDTTVLTGGSTISGQVVNLHMSRLPGPFYNGAPLAHTTAWVGLNVGPTGEGKGVFAKRASSDGKFAIPDVPPGSYQLVIWDEALDVIFGFHNITVLPDGSCTSASGSCALGQVPVFQWFTRQEHEIFYDKNQNGIREEDEKGIPELAVNLRWRDGTLYQSMATDLEGFVPFDQIFPFFSWLVAEVDYGRLKATGVTIVVDEGGPTNPDDPLSAGGQLTPQLQADGQRFRVETGPVLTQAFQGMIGQTSTFKWGKKEYAAGENGGVSGMVRYATTRAENDPRYAAAENWEPGIPNVTVNLYDETGTTLLDSVQTDSWDAALPTGCVGPAFTYMGQQKDCFDGLKNWNQVRPGVFDGGYAFSDVPAGTYVVEVVPPPGYEIVKEEDRNVDFGDELVPSTQLLPPECVGQRSGPVPDQFSLFPLVDENGAPVKPYRAGETPPLCNRKKVKLNDRQNAAADFFLFVPGPGVAAHVMGFVLDDAANEFDPNAPTFGEKYAPPFLPVSFQDWTGREVNRVYTDEYGSYNALLPGTYTANQPAPSGMGPNMITACINSSTKPDPTAPGGWTLDPFYNPQYSQFCYTFQFMPGVTTYLDTPVLPVAAFAGPNQQPLDCELPSQSPRIYSVTGPGASGPAIAVPTSASQPPLTIVAPNASTGGKVQVPNPAYDGTAATPKTIERDYGFGTTPGTVKLGNLTLTISSWTPGVIVATVPPGATTGQLVVTRGDADPSGIKRSSINGVTVTVGSAQPVYQLKPNETIQQAIDAAAPGTTILVPPGYYRELVIMWKPVRLQGWGEGAIIDSVKVPAEKLQAWRSKILSLVNTGSITLLPGQVEATLPGDLEPGLLFSEEGPGILVAGKNVSLAQGGFGTYAAGQGGLPNSRIDGFTITGGDNSGGILVNAFARDLQISNTRIVGNNGTFGGGIRVGHPTLIAEQANNHLIYPDAQNHNLKIKFNQIVRNGGLGGLGGGIAVNTGTDNYSIEANYICGNFSAGGGGGIGHFGRSPGGRIVGNQIIFNESFNQGTTVNGGGIAVVGAPPLTGSTLSPGTGTVRILDNVILGNSAGAGDGGGVAIIRVTGADLETGKKGEPKDEAILINNMITNNVAAYAGGGISLQDSALVKILHNVVSNNESTATAGEAFPANSPNQSQPQPAGIVSRQHSPAVLLALAATAPRFSSPLVVNSIIRNNRSFYFTVDTTLSPPYYALVPGPAGSDLGVLPIGTGSIATQSCIVGGTGPLFVSEYFNGARSQTVLQPEVTTAIQAAPAFDEGGNWIRVTFGPLTRIDTTTLEVMGDYHLLPGSSARGQGQAINDPPAVRFDIDGQPRPLPANTMPDIGADEQL